MPRGLLAFEGATALDAELGDAVRRGQDVVLGRRWRRLVFHVKVLDDDFVALGNCGPSLALLVDFASLDTQRG